MNCAEELRKIAEEIDEACRADFLNWAFWAGMQARQISDRLRKLAKDSEVHQDDIAGDAWESERARWQDEHNRKVREGMIEAGERSGQITRFRKGQASQASLKERVL